MPDIDADATVDTDATGPTVDTDATDATVDTDATGPTVDAVLLVSFGGPEGPDDVLPFMRNVTEGRGIPDERLEEVSEHYFARGGVSPIQEQCRALRSALEAELRRAGHDLRVYWGNRNWDPYLADTLREMAADGVGHAVAVLTSAYSSYSGCRQYREDVERARQEIAAEGIDPPTFEKVRAYYNHPGFVLPHVDYVRDAIESLPGEEQPDARVVFTTHSIPHTMSRHCDYEVQTYETCRLVMEELGTGHGWDLVYNSRSGPPFVPWLEPDVNDHLEALAADGVTGVVVVPIGFVSDHMEVVHDLDTEAAQTAERVGLAYARAATVGTDARFVTGLRELLEEHLTGAVPAALGVRGPNWTACPVDCCLTPGQEAVPAIAQAAPPRGRPGR